MTRCSKTAFLKYLALPALAGMLLFTGCGKESTLNTSGMEKVSALDYAGAINDFDMAIEAGEDKELAYRGKGMAYLGLTDYENAVASFETALSEAGMFPSGLETDIACYLATAQYRAGDKEGAVATLDSVAGMKEKDPDAYFLRGSVKMELGQYEAAVEDLNLALYYSDHDTAMTIRIYQVFEAGGHKEEGRSYLSNAIEERLSSMSDYEKGIIYYYMEDYENARNNLEACRAAGNRDTQTLLMLGKTYEQLGDSNYAAGLYRTFLDENEPDATIYNQLGLCKLRTGQYEDALSAFNGGLAMENNASVLRDLRFNQIVAYEYMGDFQKAASLIRDYISAYPDDETAKREFEFLKSR